ncbi:GYDIA family GHMP kinase [uncultured Olleya sp.]|uniref:GYDIA family GHMP kinase n=1 Tax=uncultured Olleya sp. TaxID=757243 RepID=UPI002593BD1D|nr:GYDIA family GHMP kinase [uncultured Olleya sp.]
MQTFYSHGKLLLTAEYVVLDGAKALAVPTIFGQYLTVETITEPEIIWTSIDNNNKVWFETSFLIERLNSPLQSKDDILIRLHQILNAAKQLNPDFLNSNTGYKITTRLEFPKNWGLGTSSTLINNIAQWAKVDAYNLLERSFGGSGYDIACAKYDSAIAYQIKNSKPTAQLINFRPSFSDQLYFIHLNTKQNSREGIAHYKANRTNLTETIEEVNQITASILNCMSLKEFTTLIDRHEVVIAKVTNQNTVKNSLFKDFSGSIKSLGAWGGDFILAASKTNPTDYFKAKGYTTILKYNEMVL